MAPGIPLARPLEVSPGVGGTFTDFFKSGKEQMSDLVSRSTMISTNETEQR